MPSFPAGKTQSPVEARVPTGHDLPCSSSFLPPRGDVRYGQPRRLPPRVRRDRQRCLLLQLVQELRGTWGHCLWGGVRVHSACKEGRCEWTRGGWRSGQWQTRPVVGPGRPGLQSQACGWPAVLVGRNIWKREQKQCTPAGSRLLRRERLFWLVPCLSGLHKDKEERRDPTSSLTPSLGCHGSETRFLFQRIGYSNEACPN